MKLKNEFMVAELGDGYAAVPKSGSETLNCIIRLNETGMFIWKALEDGLDEHAIISKMTSEYDVSEEMAGKSVRKILENLLDAGLLEK